MRTVAAALTLLAAFAAAGECEKKDKDQNARFGPRGRKGRHAARVVRKADADKNGAVTAAEWDAYVTALPVDENGQAELGPRKVAVEKLRGLFTRLDRDKNGVVDKADRKSRRPNRGAGLVARAADTDESGDVSAAEWTGFKALVTRDGVLSVEQLTALVAGPRGRMIERALDRNRDGTLTLADLDAIHAELDKSKDGALQADEMPRKRRRPHRRK